MIPGATWTAAGIGREQARVMGWALARGPTRFVPGSRTTSGDQGPLAASNAELVSLAAEMVTRHNRKVATPAEARALLHLKPAS